MIGRIWSDGCNSCYAGCNFHVATVGGFLLSTMSISTGGPIFGGPLLGFLATVKRLASFISLWLQWIQYDVALLKEFHLGLVSNWQDFSVIAILPYFDQSLVARDWPCGLNLYPDLAPFHTA